MNAIASILSAVLLSACAAKLCPPNRLVSLSRSHQGGGRRRLGFLRARDCGRRLRSLWRRGGRETETEA